MTKSKTSNGITTYTSTQTFGDETITSTYDADGVMTSYVITTTDSSGNIIKEKYTVKDGSAVLSSSSTEDTGTGIKTVTSSSGAVTKKTADGTSVKINSSGKLAGITTSTDNLTTKFSYSSSGNLSSVTINGIKYTNISEDDNSTIVKDENGNIVSKITTNEDGTINVKEYTNGTISKETSINKYGYADDVWTYDSDGNRTSRTRCEQNLLREYTRNSDGEIISSTDYKNGIKYSTQTYLSKEDGSVYANLKERQWATVTYYDENGDVISYTEYSYEQSSDKNTTTVTSKTYSSSDKKELTNYGIHTKDSYGNELSVTQYNPDGSVNFTKDYTYSSDTNSGKLYNSDLTSTTMAINLTGQTVESNYYSNARVKNEIVTEKDNSKKEYSYEYYSNGKVKIMTLINGDGSTTVTSYDSNGNKTKVVETSSNGVTATTLYDSDGNEISGSSSSIESDVEITANLTDSQQSELERIIEIYSENKDIYEDIAAQVYQDTGIYVSPYAICAIHYRESDCDFNTYLHNGQTLGQITTIEPAGIYFDNFRDAAVDAIERELDSTYTSACSKYGVEDDCSTMSSLLMFCERYNGFGYRNNGCASAYVYSGTTTYTGGMYTSDGNFSSSSYDSRCGTAIIIKTLMETFGTSQTDSSSIVDYAESFIGYNESDGSANIFLNGLSSSSISWCAAFVEYVLENSGASIPDWYTNCSNKWYCPTIYNSASSADAIISSSEVQAGDIVLFDWDGDGIKDHIGIVTSVNSDGTINTIEGNSSNQVRTKSYTITDSRLTYVKITD